MVNHLGGEGLVACGALGALAKGVLHEVQLTGFAPWAAVVKCGVVVEALVGLSLGGRFLPRTYNFIS